MMKKENKYVYIDEADIMRRRTEDSNVSRKIITLKNFELVDGYVKDTAFVMESNDSAVIENMLLDKILPTSPAAAYYVRSIYTVGLKKTYMTLMNLLSEGLDFKAAYDNAYDIVKFGMNVILQQPFVAGIDPDYKDYIPYLKSCCDSILRKLEYETQNRQLSFDQREMLADDKILLECDFRNEINFRPQHYFRVVLSRWDILGNYTFTYRMLFAVVALSNSILWDEPKHRLMARDVIAEVCKDWEY